MFNSAFVKWCIYWAIGIGLAFLFAYTLHAESNVCVAGDNCAEYLLIETCGNSTYPPIKTVFKAELKDVDLNTFTRKDFTFQYAQKNSNVWEVIFHNLNPNHQYEIQIIHFDKYLTGWSDPHNPPFSLASVFNHDCGIVFAPDIRKH